MNEIQDVIVPGMGKLNTDDSLWTMMENDSRFRLNVIVDDDGDSQLLTNTLGNENVAYTLGSGTNKVIGFVEDSENKAGIYFVYNTSGNHRILRYRVEQNDIQEIITEIDFDLTFQDTYIHSDVIGIGGDKILTWTDGVNPPRQINIERAIINDYSPITEEKISAIKSPPLEYSSRDFSPERVLRVLYTDVISNNYNYIKGRLFQFAIRYKYSDNSYSVFSEFASPLPEEEDLTPDSGNQEPTSNNGIQNIS
jgi:hypothetical protein